MKLYRLVFEREHWTLREDGRDQPVEVYENQPKGDAIQQAVEAVQDRDASLTIYKSDGTVAETREFPEEEDPADFMGKAIPLRDIAELAVR